MREEFLALPELKENPLVQRVVQVFDADNNGEVNFSEFVSGLAMFTTKNVDKQKKLKFLFNIYDLDRDGLISNSELFQVQKYLGSGPLHEKFVQVLKMMVGSNMTETQLQQIVDKTILQLDKDQDGMINYQEFCDIVGESKK